VGSSEGVTSGGRVGRREGGRDKVEGRRDKEEEDEEGRKEGEKEDLHVRRISG
jgi:hypothetical protein